MWSRRRSPVRALVVTLALAGCGRDQPVPAARPVDSLPRADSAPAPAAVAAPDDRGWFGDAGPALYLPSDAGTVRLVLPTVADDSVPLPHVARVPAGAAATAVELFAASGRVGRGTVGEYVPGSQVAPVPGCDAWPELPLRRDAAATGKWQVALAEGTATALPLDSATALATGDSTLLVADVIRATSTAAIAGDSAAVALARVPFAVLGARRATLPDGTALVVATVERRVNSEADPRVERTTVVLERARGAGAWTVAWRDRQYVAEDELVSMELLAAVMLRKRGDAPLLFLGLDFGDGTRVEALVRTKPGEWRVGWSSAYTGC